MMKRLGLEEEYVFRTNFTGEWESLSMKEKAREWLRHWRETLGLSRAGGEEEDEGKSERKDVNITDSTGGRRDEGQEEEQAEELEENEQRESNGDGEEEMDQEGAKPLHVQAQAQAQAQASDLDHDLDHDLDRGRARERLHRSSTEQRFRLISPSKIASSPRRWKATRAVTCEACGGREAKEGLAGEDAVWILKMCSACALHFSTAVSRTLVLYRRCVVCSKWAVFGSQEDKRPVACRLHRSPEHADVVHKRCCHPGCSKTGTFFGNASALAFCKAHARSGHAPRRRTCQHLEGCATWPLFAAPSDPLPRFCRAHKLPHHVDVVSPRCQAPGCRRQPSFGSEKEGVLRYCRQHTRPDHASPLRSSNNRCQALKCTRQAVFGSAARRGGGGGGGGGDRGEGEGEGGEKGGKEAVFCRRHKQLHHVNIRYKPCQAVGCSRHPTFNFPSLPPKFCLAHKRPGQVNVPRLKELCRHRDSGASNLSSSSSSLALASAAGSSCNVRACYGPPGGKALYCTRHKLAGHVDVINGRCHGPPEPTGSRKFKLNLNGSDSADPGPADRRASDSDSLSGNGTASGCGDAKRGVTCSRRPSFGLPSDRHPRFCKEHRSTGQVNLNRRRWKPEKAPKLGLRGDQVAPVRVGPLQSSFNTSQPSDTVVSSIGSAVKRPELSV